MQQLTASELSIFCEQLKLVVKVGVSIEEGIALIGETLIEAPYRELIETIDKSLHEGKNIAEAFEATGACPSYMIHMLTIGLTSGKLEDVVAKLEAYYEQEAKMQATIKKTLYYPMMLVGIVGGMLWVILTQVMPVFERVLASLGMQLTDGHTGMMQLGIYVVWLALVTIGVGISGVIVFWVVLKIKGMPYIRRHVLVRSKIYKQMGVQKFFSALAMMVTSGVVLEEAMKRAKPLVQEPILEGRIQAGIDALAQGMSMVVVFEQLEVLTPLELKRLELGNRMGDTDKVFEKLAQLHEEGTRQKLESVLAHVEPTVIIMLAIVIGSLLASVMLPLLQIMATLG